MIVRNSYSINNGCSKYINRRSSTKCFPLLYKSSPQIFEYTID